MDVVDLYAMFACLLCIQIRLQSIDKLALRARCCKYVVYLHTVIHSAKLVGSCMLVGVRVVVYNVSNPY